MNNKPDKKPFPFASGEFGLSEVVMRAIPLAHLGAPNPALFVNPADIEPARRFSENRSQRTVPDLGSLEADEIALLRT
ncbi:MAG: hypothetical protein UU09_C0015G0004 [Microgenomates group bacterium GW2011_GWA2_40_6]|nr:MAG: hypothetical protein UU09_C0015G0004 [Microgenomates group bacterium GW2011_GWA2_40_6]